MHAGSLRATCPSPGASQRGSSMGGGREQVAAGVQGENLTGGEAGWDAKQFLSTESSALHGQGLFRGISEQSPSAGILGSLVDRDCRHLTLLPLNQFKN